LGPGEREIYDYPAEIKTHSQGVRVANVRMQSEEARITSLTGSGNCRAFASGYRFSLNSDRRDIQETDWVLTQVSQGASQPILHSRAGSTEATSYTNSFTCMPHGMPYRHPLTIAKPVIGGVQTAFVVGPEGEEIHTDAHGRVKVRFHWDREGENNENSSCWIRVAQMWAGPGWGGLFIPRIGHEVILGFIEGDPDRPLITGSVYNGNNRLPYDLSPNQTRSTIKSNSSPGGNGFNEIRLEDAAGEEEIYIHAQKDRNEETLNDQTLSVGNNRTARVEADDTETIGNNQSVDVGGSQTITVQGPVSIQSGGSTRLVLDGNITIRTAGSITVQGSNASISASSISLTASQISLNAPMVTSAGIVQCQTLITNAVVSPTYTPGAGNVW
jgi:type VI secretion system secreted protein VgrG